MRLDRPQVVGNMVFVFSFYRGSIVCLAIATGVFGSIADAYVQELKKRHRYQMLV